MSQTQEIKAFSQKLKAAVLIFGGVTKIQIQIFNCQFSRGLIQPANRVASTTEWNYTNIVVNCLLISYLYSDQIRILSALQEFVIICYIYLSIYLYLCMT